MHTSPLQKTISRVFPNSTVASAIEVIFLLSLGMVALLLHAKLRMPMGLPGKQGLLFMAVILTGKGLSKFPFASSLSGIGAATLLLMPGLGFHDPFMALNYLFLGCLIDLVYGLSSKYTSNVWILGILCGACWMFIPFFRLTMSLVMVIPVSSFRNGILYPFATHFIFGMAGGLAAAGVMHLIRKRS